MRRRPYLDLIAWNAWTGNSYRNVWGALTSWHLRYSPDMFALSEVATHHDTLSRWCADYGYTLLQETPARRRKAGKLVDDTGDCAILVRNGVTIRHAWTHRMRRIWLVLRYRRWHTPHAYAVVNARVRRQVWRVRSSHWPTHGFDGRNGAAVLESARKSRRWLRRSVAPSIDVGDLNARKSVLADWYGKRFRVYGQGIDVAVTHGVRDCEWTELGKGGSDGHHARLYRFTA